MKTRFKNNSEVAHIWASQTQHEGRGSNLFFEGTKIYSYGRHFCIANFVRPNVVLFNSAKYSKSTAKHQLKVRSAIPANIKVFTVPQTEIMVNSHERNLQYYLNTIEGLVEDAKRSIKNTDAQLNVAAVKRERALDYIATFDLRIDETRGLSEAIANYQFPDLSAKIETQREKAANREALQEAKRQEGYKIIREYIPAWLEGVAPQMILSDLPEVYLREMVGTVETSKGAIVPLREAKLLYDMIEAGKDIVGHRIGSYTVISLNGVLTIGCHKIEREEIKRFASVMGW